MATNSVVTAQVLITINGKSLTLSNYKKHVVSLKVTRVEGEQANTFSLQVFDKSAWDLEALLAKSKSVTGTSQGLIGITYSNALDLSNTKSFSGIISNYSLDFVGSATMLSLTGVVGEVINTNVWFTKQAIQWVDSTPVNPLNRKGQIPPEVYNFLNAYFNPPYPLPDDWEDPELPAGYEDVSPIALYRLFWSVDGKGEDQYGQYTTNRDICAILDWSLAGADDISAQPRVLMNPANIFIRIMKKYRGEIGSASQVSGESIGNYVEPQQTLWVEGLETVQSANQTAADYIQNILCKAAVLDTGDTSTMTAGYRYFVDGKGHHFEPIDWNGSASDTVNVGYNVKNSNIISFKFDDLGAMVMAQSNTDDNGDPLLASSSLDYYTGSMITSNLSAFGGYGISESTDANGNVTDTGNWYFTKYSTIRISSSQSQSVLTSNLAADFSKISSLCFSATMVVWANSNKTYSPRKVC